MSRDPNLSSPRTSAATAITNCHTLVVKLGSSLLVDETSKQLNRVWLKTLIADLSALTSQQNKNVIIVSSGAIALGCLQMGYERSQLRLAEIQAAAAIGQITLAHEFAHVLEAHGLVAAQVLLTLDDTEQRTRYLNARKTLEALLKTRVIPVINENDTVATSEIRFGDNDRLAARVAQMMSADCLLLLSDIDGLYAEDPRINPQAPLLERVDMIDATIESMAGGAGTRFGTGGMSTKLVAAKLAVQSGCHMILASGLHPHPLQRVLENAKCTHFVSGSSPVTKRKQWIAGSLQPRGTMMIDAGAVQALRAGSSLLPVGLLIAEGEFERGDAVHIIDQKREELGRGLSAYASHEVALITGVQSSEIVTVLGYPGPDEIIHRDDLALL